MFRKTCENCGHKSYSSSSKKWICPICEKDITGQEVEEIEDEKD